MIGCVGEALSDKIDVDFHELAEARWFDRATVLAALAGDKEAGLRVPPPVAVAHHLISHWATRQGLAAETFGRIDAENLDPGGEEAEFLEGELDRALRRMADDIGIELRRVERTAKLIGSRAWSC